MLKFEMWAPQVFWVWLLSRVTGVSFTEARPALCTEIAYLLQGKYWKTSSHQNKLGETANSNFTT